MITYPEIQGPNKAPQGHCIAFKKYDGTNIRVEWSRKRSWYKFGTKKMLIDFTHPIFGEAVNVFLRDWAEPLERLITDTWLSPQSVVVFGEFYGQKSFAGLHEERDYKYFTPFDLALKDSGFLTPREFVRVFAKLPVAEVVYEGNFSKAFRQAVFKGEYPVDEGVVAKGLLPMRHGQNNIWMSKCKTWNWMEKLRQRAKSCPELSSVLRDNEKEQETLT